MKKKIGLHIRIERTLTEAIDKAVRLKLPLFQSFFVTNAGTYIRPTEDDVKVFLAQRHNVDMAVAHSSFWINLCNTKEYSVRLLKKELVLAKKFAYTHLIVHPGSAKEFKNRMMGIDLLASRLDMFFKHEKTVKIVLENTAHAGYTVGSYLEDFKLLQDKVDMQLYYCIDTAHAYVHGYDIKNNPELFIQDVDTYMGLKNVVLIHLNESNERCGSHHDKHGIPGQGFIGSQALKKFIEHDELKGIPIIMELPELTEEQEVLVLQDFL